MILHIRKIFLVFFLLISSPQIYAQITLSGGVYSLDNEPLKHANVALISEKNTYKIQSDSLGNFIFEKVEADNYSLKITALGYVNYSKRIEVKFSKYLDVIYLKATDDVLQTVEVVGTKAQKYYSDYSFSATKIATINKEIPQAISTITKELMQDRQVSSIGEAMKNVNGVAPTSFYSHFAIRGITQNEEGAIINGMRSRQFYFVQPLTNHLERIEVIKGPASATFSSVDPGGSINMVTKKPLKVNRKTIHISSGSFSTIRAALDFTGPINQDSTLLYRLNVGYEDAKSFRDLQFRKALLIAPSFSFIPTEKTALNVEMVINQNNTRLDRGQPIFGAIPGVTSLYTTPVSFAMGNTDDFMKTGDNMLMATFGHQITKRLKFNVNYMKQIWSENLYENRTSNAFAVDAERNFIPTLASMRAVKRRQNWNNDNLSTYFNWNYKNSTFESQLVVGYDMIVVKKLKGGSSSTARGYLRKDGTATSFNGDTTLFQMRDYTVDIDGQMRTIRSPVPNVPNFDLANPRYTISDEKNYVYTSSEIQPAYYRIHGLYLQEQLSYKKWIFTIGLRNEWYLDIANHQKENEFEQTYVKLLPRFGLTYKINDHINAYGTYLMGYQPQSNTSSLMLSPPPANVRFKPYESDLKEFGFKSEWFNNRMVVNLAFYDIKQKNITVNANDPDNVDLFVQRGAERSNGVELELMGAINDNWNINLGYSYINARITDDVNSANIGLRTANAPIHSGNLWTRYDFQRIGNIKGIGLGAGLQLSGDRVPFYTRAFMLPGYAVMDMALYYKPENSKVQIQLNANNVFNKTYWAGAFDYNRLFPGAPRNVMLNVMYKF